MIWKENWIKTGSDKREVVLGPKQGFEFTRVESSEFMQIPFPKDQYQGQDFKGEME